MLEKTCGAIRISKVRGMPVQLFGDKFPSAEFVEIRLHEGRFIDDDMKPTLKTGKPLVEFYVSYEALGAALMGRLSPITLSSWEGSDLPPLIEENYLEKILDEYTKILESSLAQVEFITREIMALQGSALNLSILSRLTEIMRVMKSSGPALINKFQHALELSR